MEAVYVKVFEDYKIVGDYIHPVGDMSIKKLTNDDILKAVAQFINIETPKDVVRFAKKYGLLNRYDFFISWFVPSEFRNMAADIILDTKKKEKRKQNIDIDIDGFEDWVKKISTFSKRTKDIEFLSKNLLNMHVTFECSCSGIGYTFTDYDKFIIRATDSSTSKASIIYFLPIDKRIIYKDREINDFIQKHGWGCIGEIDIKESMEEKEKYASKRIDIYTDTLLYIFKKLYNSETKTVSPNFLLHCIGEATYNWRHYAEYLKWHLNAINPHKKRQISKSAVNDAIEDKAYRNKYIIDAQLKIFYDDDGNPKIDVTFNNLHDALGWFVISNKGRLKICPTCRKAFIGRKNQIYCSNNCKFNNWYRANSPKK